MNFKMYFRIFPSKILGLFTFLSEEEYYLLKSLRQNILLTSMMMKPLQRLYDLSLLLF